VNPGPFTEDLLVEQPAIELLAELGWSTVNAYAEKLGPDGTLGRDNHGEVVLLRHLRHALERLNPMLPEEAIEQATIEVTKDRSAMDPIRANREVYDLVKDGVEVEVRTADGGKEPERVRVIDWADPSANDFLLVSQFRVAGDMYNRRADLVGFVNGLPLVFIELKASHHKLEEAYDGNLTDYRMAIPKVFWPNGFIILSNGKESKVGTVSSGWEHFAEWKKIDDESEAGVVSLETMLRGTCAPARLLDLIENFTAFQERPRGLVKLLARNHQYLGVNNAIRRLGEIREAPEIERGRLGVFWHTQGSGKTLSMLFFSQKVLRKVAGNWTFVVVTDRTQLDDQVYEEFTDSGVLTEGHVQATSSENLRTLLGDDHRYVFTLIQKFRADRGETYPVISERSDIVVITDEAHRSQYDVLALNMRNALPNASFLGFTGTPLISGEEKTREVFGDYVSVYDFGESIRDGATVPLYYENRIPELQLANENFDDELTQILEDAELDEAQEAKLSRLFSQQYQLVTREDRLERVAADLVDHFLGRGFPGKAMVVSIDKATAVRMYDKVRRLWDERLARGRARLLKSGLDPDERELLQAEVDYMTATDMAVVVSQGQNEILEMRRKGLDIVPHRKRMVDEDLESEFKDAANPLRIVFVCAMWTTGFDVPSCSTIYLDKPMKNHTLMQTIARANRVFPEKTNGLIVDYIGVFRNLEAALAIYAAPKSGGDGSLPVKDKTELLGWMRSAMDNALAYCRDREVDIDSMLTASGFDLIAAGETAVEQLIVDDETKVQFIAHARLVDRLFKAILPDPKANEFGPVRAVLVYLAECIASLNPTVDVSHVLGRVEMLLDASVAANAYVIHAPTGNGAQLIDLNEIDWDALAAKFAKGKKRTEAERLRAAVAAKVAELTRLNPTRVDWAERFQQLIDEYNAGSLNVEDFFARLVEFTKGLNEEQRRGLAENLDEEQLAIYDLIMRPAPELTDAERKQVKKVAESLLEVLWREKLVLDWRKEQQSRAAVRLAVEESLDELPDKFTTDLYEQKCEAVYQHVFDSYWDNGRSVYEPTE
jgi:type I restriction enzyme R subunit